MVNLREDESLVAVYGTLKSSFNGHPLILKHIERGKAEFISKGWWETNYSLFNVGPYPALLDNFVIGPNDEGEYSTSVFFEIYKVNNSVLADLDKYEGVPYLFKSIKMTMKPYENVIVYVAGPLIYFDRSDLTLIKSGNYGESA